MECMANMPLRLFAIPDEAAETNHYEIGIPKIGSWVLTHAFDGVVPGLKEVPPENRPPVWPVFFSFRIMVGIGFAMLAIGLWSFVARVRGGLAEARWLQTAVVAMGPSGFVAVLAGWITTEAGRQPYTVYGLLRTADSISPIAAAAVGASLVAFVVVYLAVFGAGTFYLLRQMAITPGAGDEPLDPKAPMHAAGITPGPSQAIANAGSERD